MPRLIPADAGLVLSLAAPAAEKERLRVLQGAVREEITALAARVSARLAECPLPASLAQDEHRRVVALLQSPAAWELLQGLVEDGHRLTLEEVARCALLRVEEDAPEDDGDDVCVELTEYVALHERFSGINLEEAEEDDLRRLAWLNQELATNDVCAQALLAEVQDRLQDGSRFGWRGVLRTWVDGW